MHLLNITQCTNLGGMERSNLARLIGLKARGCSVHLISLNPIGKLGPLLRDADIPMLGLRYSGKYGCLSWFAMRQAFSQHKADGILMTGHNLMASLALADVPAKKKVLALHHHHFEPGIRSWQWPVIYSVAERVFDHLTFSSAFIRQEALTIRPSLESKSSVLPNPFDVPPLPTALERREARARLGVPPLAQVVGNAGWLIPRKCFDVFMRVAAKILARQPNVIFLIGGDGTEKERLKTLAKDLGIQDRVRFLGWREDLSDFYKSLDVLLFNSDFDALGRTPVEAAAFGVPVVASVIKGGLTEVFESPEEATILAEHDIDQLAAAVLRLLKNDGERTLKIQKAQRRVKEYGDLDRHVTALERLLRD